MWGYDIHAFPMPQSLTLPVHYLPPLVSSRVLRDLDEFVGKKPQTNPPFDKGLKQLCERKDLVIRPAVILDKLDYQQEMFKILGDQNTYGPLNNNSTFSYKKKLIKLIDKGFKDRILDKKEKAYLIPVAPCIPTIYYLTKIQRLVIHLVAP